MEDEQTRLDVLEQKIDMMQVTLDKIKRYFFWTLVVTVTFFILPLIAAIFIVPFAVDSLTSSYSIIDSI